MTREARGDALSSQCVWQNSCCIQEHHVRSDKLSQMCKKFKCYYVDQDVDRIVDSENKSK